MPPTSKAPAKGLSPKGTEARKPTDHTIKIESTIHTTAMPSTPQVALYITDVLLL